MVRVRDLQSFRYVLARDIYAFSLDYIKCGACVRIPLQD